MPRDNSGRKLVEAFIAEAERIVSNHCNADNPAGFLDAEGRSAQYRRLGEVHQRAFDCLRPCIGDAAARALCGGVLARVRRMLNWADAETFRASDWSEESKAKRLATLRREYETSDLELIYTELRSAIESRTDLGNEDPWVPYDHDDVRGYMMGAAPVAYKGQLSKLASRNRGLRRAASDADRQRWSNPNLRHVYNLRKLYELTEGKCE